MFGKHCDIINTTLFTDFTENTDISLLSASAPPKTGFFMDPAHESFETFSSRRNNMMAATNTSKPGMIMYPPSHGSYSNFTNIMNSPAANHLNIIENAMLRDELMNAQVNLIGLNLI